jgi:hypothetical protein
LFVFNNFDPVNKLVNQKKSTLNVIHPNEPTLFENRAVLIDTFGLFMKVIERLHIKKHTRSKEHIMFSDDVRFLINT